jgi:hypothetical protein
MMEVEWDAAHRVAGPHAAHGIQGFPGGREDLVSIAVSVALLFLVPMRCMGPVLRLRCSPVMLQR